MIYVAYGSNLLPARLAARCPSAEIRGTVELPGWRLAFHKVGSDGSAKCDLVPDEDEIAHGALYHLSDEDRPVLDRIEGVGFGYQIHRLELEGVGPAWLYRAEAAWIAPNLRPYDWYHRFVLEGARHHRFPETYVARLEAVATRPDPNPDRRAAAAAVLEASRPMPPAPDPMPPAPE